MRFLLKLMRSSTENDGIPTEIDAISTQNDVISTQNDAICGRRTSRAAAAAASAAAAAAAAAALTVAGRCGCNHNLCSVPSSIFASTFGQQSTTRATFPFLIKQSTRLW